MRKTDREETDVKKNTMDLIEYIQNYAFTGEMFLLGYYYTVFISLQGYSAAQSLLVLEVALLCGLALDLLPVLRVVRNGWSILTTMFLILGSYTFVTYYRNYPGLYLGILAVTAAVAASYLVWVFVRKNNAEMEPQKKFRRRMQQGSMGIKTVAAVIGVFFILCAAATKYLPQAEDVLCKTVYTDEDALAAHIEELRNLQPEKYAGLTVDEKIQLLQVIANIEGRYLGLDTRITVGCSDLKEDTLGYYRDATKEIQIDMEYLDSEPRKVVCLLCHEMYHAAQHQYARIYDKLSQEEKKSYFLTEAAIYAKELKDYKNGEEGGVYEYFAYYSQSLEREARAYGLASAEQIFERIEEEDAADDAETVEPVRAESNTLTALPGSETYYKNNEIVQVVNYEYNDGNRQSASDIYERNDATGELGLVQHKNYTYDEYFIYEDTTHMQEDNAVTRVVTDAEGNEIISQGIFSGGILTSTYTYEYRENTERKQVQYCYEGEEKNFSRLTIVLYNKYGDEIYKLIQAGSDRIYEYRTIYTYNDMGQLSSKKVSYAMDGEPAYMTRENSYSYDEKGQLVEEVLMTCMGLDISQPAHTDKVWIRYEYDALGREIRREQKSQMPGEPVWKKETSYENTCNT